MEVIEILSGRGTGVPCPFCEDGLAFKAEEDMTVDYRGAKHTVRSHFYKCNSCEEEFETSEQMEKTLSQLPGYSEWGTEKKQQPNES